MNRETAIKVAAKRNWNVYRNGSEWIPTPNNENKITNKARDFIARDKVQKLKGGKK